ncbi:MAG: hypothetical protein U1E62_25100 [Alsobacter sp.]
MTTNRLLLVIVLLGLAAGNVRAADADLALPRFDPQAYCLSASVNSNGAYDKAQCAEDERRSVDLIRQQWSHIPRDVQVTCSEIIRRSGQSYFNLKACLKNFAGAAWSTWQEEHEILDRSQQIARSFQRR